MSNTIIPLPLVSLGRTGRLVSRVGLGGEGALRTHARAAGATAVIEAAIAHGITYYDSARAYDDSELYYGQVWGRGGHPRREALFLTSKSAERRAGPARRELEETLSRLQLDYLDLWQIHDVRTMAELAAIAAPGGALEAFVAAKEAGLVRHIGVTGHHDPAVLTRAVETFPVDTVLLPVNPMEGVLGGFLTETLPAARARGLGVIGMKALGGAGGHGGAGGGRLVQAGLDATTLLRYALTQDVDVLIVGCATPAEVATLAELATTHEERGSLLDDQSRRALLDDVRPSAGRLAGYRGVLGPPC